MAKKTAVPVILGLGAGVVALVLLTRKAKAAPAPEIPSAEIPTVNEIMGARSIAKLNTYYRLINELFIIGKLTHGEYTALYDAYEARFYELIGVGNA